MLLSKSPVRSISEKLKSPQASIKDMKIERKKDFRSFLKYIERESKELEKIKLPSRNEVTKKSGSGGIGALLGLGALGLLGLFGGMGDKGNQYKYGDKNLGGNIFKGPYAVGRDRKGEDDDQKIDDPITDLPDLPKSTMLSRESRRSFQVGAVNAAELLNKEEAFQGRKIKKRRASSFEFSEQQVVAQEVVAQETSGASSIIDPSQSQFSKGKNRGDASAKKFLKPSDRDIIRRAFSTADDLTVESILNNAITPQTKEFLTRTGQAKFDKALEMTLYKSTGGEFVYFSQLTDGEKIKIVAQQLELQKDAAARMVKNAYKGISKKEADNILKNKKGFFNSIKRDFKKPTLGINTMEDMFSKLRLGKKTDLFKANPKGMNLFKLGTFSKGKTGFMIADFGLAAYDLYSSLRKVTPRSNIGATLLDLVGININNFVADMLNNPGMLREYVSVTNDPNAINVNRNREIINENIRKIKEQNKKDFTGADITKGSITGKQMMENMKKYFTNPQTYNPFSTYQVKPNPDLFTKPSGDPNDDVLSIFQSAAMEAN